MKKNILAVFFTGLMLTVLFFSFKAADAATLKDSDVPRSLSKWKSWVLYNMEDKLCPTN